ncbi:MAG: YifB family Mg chelatase-like AAA ATPase [Bacillota bacterium]|nr:YifB family Mg chelatase-like AAA ATPase [Bacillota bacterium]
MVTRVYTASLIGVRGYLVTVESDIHQGMPSYSIVGLADTTIRESFRRIRSALVNCSYDIPAQKITVNLVPAGKRKEGSHFDLPIAMGLIFSGKECRTLENTAFFGELSLDGRINHIKGALPLALSVRREGIKRIVIPASNAGEVSIIKDMEIIPVTTLEEAATFVMNPDIFTGYMEQGTSETEVNEADFDQVIGQESVKRALVIAAAGNHGVLMMGEPGCGKTMMAKRIPGIMPKLTTEEQLEISGIYSVAGLLDEMFPYVSRRPFRSPHHTISAVGLIGGGSGKVRPGELSLAHGGVLFLDELGEFDNRTIDAIRQPLEEGMVRIHRNSDEIIFPAECLVIAAANPCKCGNLWSDTRVCTCTPRQLHAYARKLTGPFADRIDMHIKVNKVSREDVNMGIVGASTEEMKKQVEECRKIQNLRYKDTSYETNSSLDNEGIRRYCIMSDGAGEIINRAYDSMSMNMRTYCKLVKIARTIADLAKSEAICEEHIAEALMYRVEG